MGSIVWAAIGLAAAAFGAEYFLPEPALPYIAAALAALSPLALLLRGRARKNAWLLAGFAAGGLLLWWGRYELRVAPCEALAGRELTLTARVEDYLEQSENRAALTVTVLDGAPQCRAVFYLYGGGLPALEPGDIVRLGVKTFSVAEYTGPYTVERSHFFLSAGCCMAGYIAEDDLAGHEGSGLRYFPQRLHRSIVALCARLFPDDAAAFMQALLTGDKAELYADTAAYRSMRLSGVLHIVAVSGMHLFILVGFLQLILGRGRRTSLICLPVMAAFVLMTGCGASVVRAALMQTALLLAPVFDREYDSAASLSAALMAILLINPMAIGGVALQLSFSCVLGFVVFLPRLTHWMHRRLPMGKRLVRHTADSVACTLCASVFSLPVAAYYFGTIPLFAVLANLLTLPLVELLFSAGYALCALGAVLPGAGAALAWALAWPARWCLLVYRLIAAVPFSCLYTADPGAVAWLASAYALFFAWLLLRRLGVRVTPLIPAELGVLGLCLVLLTGGLGGDVLTVLDVGQGECVVLADDNAAVVIDCGGSGRYSAGDRAAEYLLSAGRTRVDALILTHLHADHTNGAEALLDRMRVACLIYPAEAGDDDETLGPILAAAARNGTAVLALEREHIVQAGGMTLTLMLPRAGSDENERGIVALAEFPNASALVMGDAGTSAELALLERGLVPDVDVLVAGHHGSATASGPLFLMAARGESAVVSVGRNSAGLPSEAALARLEEYCGAVLRTDRDGTVTISMEADGRDG